MRRLFFFIFIIFICHVSTVWAANWYVDKDASGSNNGASWTNAWVSFSAINWSSVKPGDTIYISGGTTSKIYYEQLHINASGSDGSPITIKVGEESEHDGTVIITNRNGHGVYIGRDYITINGNVDNEQRIRITGSSGGGVFGSSSHHIILTYLEIDNNGDTGEGHESGIELNWFDGSGFQAEISYCKIYDNSQDQIKLSGGTGPQGYVRFQIHHNEIFKLHDDGIESDSYGVDFYENVIHTVEVEYATSGAHIDGAAMNAGYHRVYNNVFYNLRGGNACIYPNLFKGTSDGHIRIYNNLVYNDLPLGELYPMKGLEFAPQMSMNYVSDVIIANNIFSGMPRIGASLWFTDNMVDFYFVNNIIHNCDRLKDNVAFVTGDGTYTDGSWGDGADVTIDYNIMHAGPEGRNPMAISYRENWGYYDDFIEQSDCQEHINGNVDPLLDANYKPQAGSLAIGNGVDMSAYFTTDMDGNTRSGSWDIGAFEGYDVPAPSPPKGLRIE
jgi:hypothetical protein